jgi:hypothetical protein
MEEELNYLFFLENGRHPSSLANGRHPYGRRPKYSAKGKFPESYLPDIYD